MAEKMPPELWQSVALHTSRKTLIRLSFTSQSIRQALLPVLFENIHLKAVDSLITLRILKTLGPEILRYTLRLHIKIEVVRDRLTKTTMPSFESEAVPSFRHIMQAMPALAELSLCLDLPTTSTTIYSPSSSKIWNSIALLLQSVLLRPNGVPRFEMSSKNFWITDGRHIGQMAKLLEPFDSLRVDHLKMYAIGRCWTDEHRDIPEMATLCARKNIASMSIFNAKHSLHWGIAEAFPIKHLSFGRDVLWEAMDIWDTVNLPQAKHLEICHGMLGSLSDLFFSQLQAPQLQHISILDLNASEIASEEGMKSFLINHKALRTVNLSFWSCLKNGLRAQAHVQTELEILKRELEAVGAVLNLELLFLSQCSLPFNASLWGHIRKIKIITDDDMVLPAHRRISTSLPTVTEVLFQLLADPPVKHPKPEDVVSRFFNYLHLPALHTIVIVVGWEPELVRLIAAKLSLLQSCQRVRITQRSSCYTEEDEDVAAGIPQRFMESLDKVMLECVCDELGIDIVYDWF